MHCSGIFPVWLNLFQRDQLLVFLISSHLLNKEFLHHSIYSSAYSGQSENKLNEVKKPDVDGKPFYKYFEFASFLLKQHKEWKPKEVLSSLYLRNMIQSYSLVLERFYMVILLIKFNFSVNTISNIPYKSTSAPCSFYYGIEC